MKGMFGRTYICQTSGVLGAALRSPPENWEKLSGFPESEEALDAAGATSVPRENDRRLVFDPRWRRSYSASMGTKPAESSRPSFVFIQALYEKGNAHAVERTTKETLFEGLNVFGAAGRAGNTSTRPVL
ncbi:hypothetical protein MRX96_027386 [Rhipicephalus microplus]